MPCCHNGHEYCGAMFQFVNWVGLKMLYISARNMSWRRSPFKGNAFVKVTSELKIREPGIGMMLPAPALPKHDTDWPIPCCGVGPGVQLQGIGITKAASFRS